MPELEYMPFYVMPWMTDTQDLSDAGYRAYLNLLCNMWLSRSCSLPDDPRVLSNRARMTPQKWRYVWPEIKDFFEVENGQVHSKTLGKVRAKALSNYRSSSERGMQGAEARWRKYKGKGHGRANGSGNTSGNATKKKRSINTSARDAREGDFSFHDLGGGVTVSQKTVDWIKEGKVDLLRDITPARARAMVDKGLVTEDECKNARVL